MDQDEEFPPLQNDLLLRAAQGKTVERCPVWVMRQAGRYLPEFREMRSKHDFFTICQTPELASEITLQPIRRYKELDAAIIFSDILVIPQAMGMEVDMKPGVGPVFRQPLNDSDDIDTLTFPVDVRDKLGYVMKAIALTRRKLEGRVPLIGFSGAPWTLMAYMIEGSGSKTWSKAKSWLYKCPDESKRLLQMITDIVVDYCVEQAKAGAQIFESNGDYLTPGLFEEFSLPYLQQISQKVKDRLQRSGHKGVPMTIFAKGIHYGLKELAGSGYDVIGIDWTVDPAWARSQAGSNVVLQGNLDPCALYASKEEIDVMVEHMVNKFGVQGYIANLGHGIYPDINPDNLGAFLKSVHSHSSRK